MKKTSLFVLLSVFVLSLTGCQTTPPEPLSVLSPKPNNETSRIVIRPYYMPLGVNFIYLFMAGGTTPFNVEIFDITGQPKYLGDIKSDGVRTFWPEDVLEYDTEPGMKILMLRIKGPRYKNHLDFIEVTANADQIENVAISQYGMMDHPYLLKNNIDQRASKYCGYTKGLKFSDAKKYLEANAIPIEKHTVGYCEAISSNSRVRHVQNDAEWKASISPESVIELKNQLLETWRKIPNKTPPYDIK